MVTRPRMRRHAKARAAHGFAYLALLVAVAVLGVGLSVGLETWSRVAMHQRAQQLEWVGQQYVRAIRSYYYGSPDGVQRLPHSLDDLIEDRRFLTVKRHLRSLYPDPLTAQPDWQLVRRSDGGIAGIQSTRVSSKKFQFVPES